MKITDIPEEPNYLPLKSGIVFKPISDEVVPVTEGKVKGHDINVLCLNDNIVYKLTLSQTRTRKKMFELVKISIKNGYLPIQVVVNKVGSGTSFHNDYDDSFIVESTEKSKSVNNPQVAKVIEKPKVVAPTPKASVVPMSSEEIESVFPKNKPNLKEDTDHDALLKMFDA